MARPQTIKRLSGLFWEIPESYKTGMRVPAVIVASEKLLDEMDEAVFDQLTNIATLPGIVKCAYCMPDGHSGYGFPIGGVAAMDAHGGVISPGGIGFDINCGMRLVTTNLTLADVEPYLEKLINRLYERVPAGVGSSGFVSLNREEFKRVIEKGSRWCLENGMATKEDLELTEDEGFSQGADSANVSDEAIERGLKQIGTLGSGNHYLEIQVVKPEHVFDRDLAKKFGISLPHQIVVMFHCGSRGFGHQVASDYLRQFLKIMEPKFGIKVLDPELSCAPFNSPEGQAYFSAMKCAINMSFANRQVILHRVREVFGEVFEKKPSDLGLNMVYDVAHNTAKLETHVVDGERRELLVHRKGATRAFEGQPVIIGGSMETGSYLLVGVKDGAKTFFSSAHGSGRILSRTKARKLFHGRQLMEDMRRRGIYVRTASFSSLAEEAGKAYKEIDEVVAATREAGISKPVVKFTPIGNVKG